jgi:4-hydroxybenzoate polyprenyltransferase
VGRVKSPDELAALKEKLDLYEKLMRLDKPIGILLLLWPTLWALWLSALRPAGLDRGLDLHPSAPC